VARAYGFVVRDGVRVKNRLKSVLRSRGVGYGAGPSVYAKRDRERWLAELPEATRPLAEVLYEEHDALAALKAKAEKALLAEARKHREWVRCFVADEPGIAMAQARSDRRALPWSNASSNYALAVA
jgi:transposase